MSKPYLIFLRRYLAIVTIICCQSTVFAQYPPVPALSEPELVMTPGMQITATTTCGTILITANTRLRRSYAWEGATRSVGLWPRRERRCGSLGAYYPGTDNHWKEHNGIARGVLQEGQQHFDTLQQALDWINKRRWTPHVYKKDGLMVAFGKTLSRKQLEVEVWQIYVNGSKPANLPGAKDGQIFISNISDKNTIQPRVEKRVSGSLMRY